MDHRSSSSGGRLRTSNQPSLKRSKSITTSTDYFNLTSLENNNGRARNSVNGVEGANVVVSPSWNRIQGRQSLHHKPDHHVVYRTPLTNSHSIPRSNIDTIDQELRKENNEKTIDMSTGLANSFRSLTSLRIDSQRPRTSPGYMASHSKEMILHPKPNTTQGRSRNRQSFDSTFSKRIPFSAATPQQKLDELATTTLSSRYFKALTCQVTAVQQLPRGIVFSDSSDQLMTVNCDTIYQSLTDDLQNEDALHLVEAKKKHLVLSCFRDVVQGFRDYEQLTDSHNQGSDSHVNKIISYGHPEDLFQICCFLYNDRCKLQSKVDIIETALKEQDQHIASLIAERESDSEYDLFKTRPSSEDVRELERSIERIEEDIKQNDPSLMREIISMGEDRKELEKRIKSQQEIHSFGIDSLKEVHGDDYLDNSLSVSLHNEDMTTNSSSRLGSVPFVTSKSINGKDSKCSLLQSNDDSNGVEYYVQLMKQKLKLLEDYILVMKKKVQRVEQVNEDVRTVLNNYGSIDVLLNDNERLKREITFYGWVNKRFDHDLLLKQDYLYVNDLPLLRSVVFALQNELYAVRSQLRYYNYEENSTLKLMKFPTEVIPEPEKLYSLERLMRDLFMDEKTSMEREKKKQAKELLAKERGFLVAKQDDFDIKSRLRQVENENEILKKQVKRYQEENNDLQKSLEIICNKNTSKNRTDEKEREGLLRTLNLKVEKLNRTITTRENHFLFQDELTKAITLEKNTLYHQNSNLTNEILSLREIVRTLREKLGQQSKGLETLYLVASSMLQYFLPEVPLASHSVHSQSIIKSMYSSTLSIFLTTSIAAIRIQSWIRGIQARRKLSRSDHLKVFVLQASERRREERRSKSFIRNAKLSDRLDLLDNMYQLFRVSTFMWKDAHDVMEFKNSLSVIKSVIITKLKEEVSREIESMKRKLEDLSQFAIDSIQTVVSKPIITRSSQTDVVESRERSVQCGVSQVTHVEMGRVLDPTR